MRPFIAESLSSALNQDYTGPLEYIVLDDASTDGSVDEIRKVLANEARGKEARLFIHRKNCGIAESMDELLSLCRGDWLVWMDGDDIYRSDRCTVAAELIARYPNSMMIASSMENVDASGKVFSRRSYADSDGNGEALPETLVLASPEERVRGYLGESGGARISGYGTAMCLNRSLWKRWGALTGADFSDRCAQDSTWELRAYLSGAVVGDARIACSYRSHAGNLYNRACRDSLSGHRQHELFWSRNQRMPLANITRQLLDIERAVREQGLSDWPREDLLRLREKLLKEREGCRMRDGWWDIPWYKRVIRSLRYSKRVPPHLKRWPLARLLPLTLFILLKDYVKPRLIRPLAQPED